MKRPEAITSVAVPEMFTDKNIERMLIECSQVEGVADILLQTGDYVWLRVHGELRPVAGRMLDQSDLELFLTSKYGRSAMGVLNSSRPLDFRAEALRSIDDIVGFRANGTRGRVGDVADGTSVTLRYISPLPRLLETLGLEQAVVDAIAPQYGLVLVVGTTGSGKSTILSSVIRARQEGVWGRGFKVLTYEDPIESTYSVLGEGYMPKVFQAEIGTGRHLESFELAGPNAMRRGADVIVLGEMRDRNSVEAGFELALTGHCVYATLHAETPAQTIDRMISFFPYDAQAAAASKLRSVLRMILAQKQFTLRAGGSQRVRSWCVFDREVNRRLGEIRCDQWEREMVRICDQRDTSFEAAASRLIECGDIDFAQFCEIANFTRAEAEAYLCGRFGDERGAALCAAPQD